MLIYYIVYISRLPSSSVYIQMRIIYYKYRQTYIYIYLYVSLPIYMIYITSIYIYTIQQTYINIPLKVMSNQIYTYKNNFFTRRNFVTYILFTKHSLFFIMLETFNIALIPFRLLITQNYIHNVLYRINNC